MIGYNEKTLLLLEHNIDLLFCKCDVLHRVVVILTFDRQIYACYCKMNHANRIHGDVTIPYSFPLLHHVALYHQTP